ncbi:MAG: Zn-dependent hydrolase [Deltaproteobacteria bacterium]|nr:Zn-dependent hydrolase [Deltaproteobacteria bacterium]
MALDLSRLRIDPRRLRNHFKALTRIGATPEGGVHRPALGDADIEGRKWLRDRIERSPLAYTDDTAGNQSAILHGRDGDSPHIMIGSHLDTVPGGGRFDGALGVLAALEVLLTLKDAGYSPPIGLEAINFTDEEGTHIGTLGSRAVTGRLTEGDLQHPFQGLPAFDSALARIGLSRKSLLQARRTADRIAGYLELHIEQGPILAEESFDIGIVTAIVGIGRLTLQFRGRADHAGTTPMALRHDAGRAAGVFVASAWDFLPENFPDCVINIGHLRFHPGTFNVVPHTVDLELEYRAPDARQLGDLQRGLIAMAKDVAHECRVAMEMGPAEISPAVSMDSRFQDQFACAANRLGLRHRRMPSGAGHDAQNFADLCPSGMIFIPSVDGRSHGPDEYSHWDDCVNGANLLLHSALEVVETYRHTRTK